MPRPAPSPCPEADFAEPAADHRRLIQELRHAVRCGRLAVRMQPRYRLDDGMAWGAAARPCWSPRRGALPPSELHALIEASGCGLAAGGAILGEACRHAASWADGIVSAPASAALWQAGALLTHTAHALAESGLPPERLELELAEADIPMPVPLDLLLQLAALRDRGVGLALGFGGYHAGLVVARDLPLTALHLDGALVRSLGTDRSTASLLKAAIAFGDTLELTTTATIDTPAQRAWLIDHGCTLGQGRGVEGARPGGSAPWTPAKGYTP